MQWMELSLHTTHEAVDWVSTMLGTTDYAGDIQVTEYLQDLGGSSPQPLDWAFTIFLHLPYDFRANTHVEEITNRLFSLHRTGQASELQTVIVAEKPSQLSLSTLRHQIGKRFVILTTDAIYQPEDQPEIADEISIRLKQSLSFGSGLHPTTIVSLQLLERHILPTMQGLDLGSGSGILSVAIAKLGASVLALDNDSIAVQSTQDAVHRNGVAQQVTVMEGSLGGGSDLGHWMGGETLDHVPTLRPTGSFDFIVANLLARVHIILADDFRRALRRTDLHPGLLMTAGFTTDYEDEVATALTNAGFEAVDCERLNEWVALAYRLKA